MKTLTLTNKLKSGLLTAIIALAVTLGAASSAQAQAVKNIVLVHGAFADGSGWKGVYQILTKKGYT